MAQPSGQPLPWQMNFQDAASPVMEGLPLRGGAARPSISTPARRRKRRIMSGDT